MNNFEYKMEAEKTIKQLKERVAELEKLVKANEVGAFWKDEKISELQKHCSHYEDLIANRAKYTKSSTQSHQQTKPLRDEIKKEIRKAISGYFDDAYVYGDELYRRVINILEEKNESV